jgi:hypothetical protein
VLGFSVDQASQLVRLAHGASGRLDDWLRVAEPWVRDAEKHFAEALAFDDVKMRKESLDSRGATQCALSAVAAELDDVMERHWRCMHEPTGHPPKEIRSLYRFYDLAEEFLAGRSVHFICYVLPALRNLSAFVLSGLLLMLFAVVFYPFQPQNDFLLFNWIVILAFIGTALTIMVQMERDFVMSSLNNTDPGKVNFSLDLVFRFVTYGMVPLTVLLGAQFPDILRKIFSVFSSQGSP